MDNELFDLLGGTYDGTSAATSSSSSNTKKKSTASNGPVIKDFVNMSTEVHVNITVQFPRGRLGELELTRDSTTNLNGVEKALKLTTTVSTTNMNMFNRNIQLHKYHSVQDIIEDYYEVRMDMYAKRKAAQVASLERKVKELSNRARFITEVVAGKIDLRKMANDDETDAFLEKAKYDRTEHDEKYDYLTRMPMHNMNKARVEKIKQEREDAVETLEELRKTTLVDGWMDGWIDGWMDGWMYFIRRIISQRISYRYCIGWRIVYG